MTTPPALTAPAASSLIPDVTPLAKLPSRISIIALSAVMLAFTGCATRYTIVMTNGTETTSKGKPELVKEVTIKDESGKSQTVLVNPHYHFTDVAGDVKRIPTARVHRIFPTSDKDDESTYYLPNNFRMPPDTRPRYTRL